ncbi:MAG: DUF885 family protein [gamma proteobacterium endosymbiont of Lamellibrachia anaximandri]|nr:DUF885 family protein [gamma proteobacterium endosymbiont of Lamellibrachia anaximandri]MBL3534380.1 DUF885 family protein [gamma proteobacterium endosymbiont of Lamellibrachia anaximandri]
MPETANFDALISEFYKVWFRYHPVAAIFAGVPGYEGLLAADGDDDVGALSSWLSNLLLGLEELRFEALDPDRQLDLQLIFGAAMIEHRMLLEQDWRHRDPARYLPLRSLQELMVRQPASLCEALQGILERTGNYLRDARTQLAELPELVSTLWLAEALEMSEAGLPWLHRLHGELPQAHQCCAEQGRLQELGSSAAEVIEDFRQFLINDLAPEAAGGSDCGPEQVNRLLTHRHQLSLTGEQALALARQQQARYLRHLDELGIDQEALGEQYVSEADLCGDARCQAYREESDRFKAFVEAQDLLELPSQPLEFRVTDGCFSRPDCGSYLRSESGGILLIPDETRQLKGGETLSAIRLRCLYSGWTGRHYLAWAGGVQAHSLVRQINPSAAFKRGWAHYISWLLEARGFFTREDMLLLARRRLALAEQALVDLEFHMGRLDSHQALDRLQSLLDHPAPGLAESRLIHLSRRPTDAFMALVGVALIEQTREVVQRQEPELSLKAFHSRLLAHGAVSLPLVVKRVFGETVWDEVSGAVLGRKEKG